MADPVIKSEALDTPTALQLIAALNAELDRRYPEEGAKHFRLDASEVAPDRGVFLVAYADGEAVGCGAVRMNEPGVAEVKRMYVRPEWRGRRVASRILAALEQHAMRLGAHQIVLETGERQSEALSLYRRAGYVEIPRFGEYLDSPLSLCLGKNVGG